MYMPTEEHPERAMHVTCGSELCMEFKPYEYGTSSKRAKARILTAFLAAYPHAVYQQRAWDMRARA